MDSGSHYPSDMESATEHADINSTNTNRPMLLVVRVVSLHAIRQQVCASSLASCSDNGFLTR